MKCDNCRSYNAKVIVLYEGEEKQHLCPWCLKVLEALDNEFKAISSESPQDRS